MAENIYPSTIAGEVIGVRGRSIVVTGGTTGIGRATALHLAAHGARVVICGRHQEELDEALRDIRAAGGADVHGTLADMASIDDIRRLFDVAENAVGGLDVLVANAALGAKGITEMAYEEWEYVVRTNLIGVMACVQEGVKRMEPRSGGHIVVIGSMSAETTEEGSSVYVATKSGVQGFCTTARKELNGKGIKLTLIEPGAVDTDMQTASQEEKREKQEKEEMLKAEEIAACVHYCLAQPERCDIVEVQIRPHMQKI